jgi:phosphate/sulfate permease
MPGSAAYSIGHGSNDAQKTMGIIAAVLFSAPFPGIFRSFVPTGLTRLAKHVSKGALTSDHESNGSTPRVFISR